MKWVVATASDSQFGGACDDGLQINENNSLHFRFLQLRAFLAHVQDAPNHHHPAAARGYRASGSGGGADLER